MDSIEDFLSRIHAWAEQQADISGVLLVGSYARGTARADSDVDLVILTSRPERYLDAISFAGNFGAVEKWEKENWGRVTSVRVWYRDGLQVEFGFALPDWAALPLDPGTRRVLADGAKIVFDRDGKLGWVQEIHHHTCTALRRCSAGETQKHKGHKEKLGELGVMVVNTYGRLELLRRHRA